MVQKYIFKILLICFALGQISTAKPANDEAKELTTTTPPNGLCNYKAALESDLSSKQDGLPSNQLFIFTVTGLVNNTVTFVERTKHFSEQILKDDELLPLENNNEIKAFMQKLRQNLEEYKNCKHYNEIENILNSFLTACMEYYQQLELEGLSSDGEIILKVLQKHGFQKLLQEFEIDTNKFFKKFDEKYESLKESINKENKKIGEHISKWYYEEFKYMKEKEEKINAFIKLVELGNKSDLENN